MTDQPETMLEYHFKKLNRTVVVVTMLLCALLLAVGGAIMTSIHTPMALVLALGGLWMLAGAHAITADGRIRHLCNRVFGTDLADLERPEERGPTEVLADD